MSGLRTPTERTCRQCGRTEAYDDGVNAWRVKDEVGRPHCLHVWDINGEFTV